MKLYEISNEYEQILESCISEDGEISDIALFEGSLEKFNEKAINVASYFNNLEVEADAIREAERKMAYRRQSIEKRVKFLKDYLLSNMLRCDIKQISCPYFNIKLAKNPPSVRFYNEKLIPDIFINVETVEKIDKTAIKKAIQAGAEVPGAKLEQELRIKII